MLAAQILPPRMIRPGIIQKGSISVKSRASEWEPVPAPSVTVDALKTRICTAYIAGRAAREVDAELANNPNGLTATGMALLHALRQGDRTITELSRFLPVAPSTLVPV